MITIIYTTIKDQLKAVPALNELRQNLKDKASARVLEFWQGEIERCDQVLVGVGCEKVASAYKAAGVTVKDLFEKAKKVEEAKPVEVKPAEVKPVEVVEPVVDAAEEVKPVEVQQESRGRGRPRKES